MLVRRRGVVAGRPHQAQGVAVLALHHGIHRGGAGAGRRQGDLNESGLTAVSPSR